MVKFNRKAKGVWMLGLLALLLAGCFGGPPRSKPKPTLPTPFILQGTVSGPSPLASTTAEMTPTPPVTPLAGRTPAGSFTAPTITNNDTIQTEFNLLGGLAQFVNGPRVLAAAASLPGETSLANVPVNAYNLADFLANPNAPVLAHTTTESNGAYKLTLTNIPLGTDLLIVVGTDPRLSAIVPNVRQNTTADVNSATTLAAEVWGRELGRGENAISSGHLRRTEDAARDRLDHMGLDADGLRDAMIALVPAQFGGGLPSDPPASLMYLVQALTASLDDGNAACWDLALPISSAQPTTLLTLSGMPPGWHDDDTWAKLLVDDSDEWFPAYIELIDGGGEAELLMPVHPINLMEGGDAKLVVYNEGEGITCSPIPIHIEPLTRASGTLSSIVDDVHGTLVTRAATFGFSKTELLTTDRSDLPPHVVGLAVGLRMIEGDDVPNNMRRVLREKTLTVNGEMLAFTAEDLELADALMAVGGFHHELSGLFDDFKDVSDSGGALPGPAPVTTSTRFPVSLAAITPQQTGMVLPANIQTPEQLAYWMDVQARCANANRGDGIAKQAMVSGGIIIAGLALIPNSASPAAALAGLALAIAQINLDMCENLLPSTLTQMQMVEIAPTEYNEDDGSEGFWRADLHVGRGEWTLDWPTTVGLIPGAGKVAGVVGKVTRQTSAALQFGEAFADWMQSMLTTAWQHNDGPLTLNGVQVSPITIEPSRPNESEYFNWYFHPLTPATAFQFNPNNERAYVPLAAGASELQVETRPGAFQNEYVSTHATLEVKAIEVNIAEDGTGRAGPFYVTPGGEITLHAEVDNADHKGVVWTSGGGSFFDDSRNATVYFAPGTSGVYSVTATSTASGGPRASNDPPRFDTVSVIVGGLNVLPQPRCVEVREPVPFTAYFGNDQIDFSELVSVVDGPGTLSLDGTFTAPSAGAVTIRVWHPDHEGMDEVVISFDVEDDCSGFTANAVGDATFMYDGTCTVYTPSETDIWVAFGRVGSPIVVNFQTDENVMSAPFAALRDGIVDAITQWFPLDDVQATIATAQMGGPFPFGGNRSVPMEGTLTITGHWNSTNEFRLNGVFEGIAAWKKMNERGEMVDMSSTVYLQFQGAPSLSDGGGGCYFG